MNITKSIFVVVVVKARKIKSVQVYRKMNKHKPCSCHRYSYTQTPGASISDGRLDIHRDGRVDTDGDGEGKAHRESRDPDLQSMGQQESTLDHLFLESWDDRKSNGWEH